MEYVRANWSAIAQTWELSENDCRLGRGKIVEQQGSGSKLFWLAFASNKNLSKKFTPPVYMKENLPPFENPHWFL